MSADEKRVTLWSLESEIKAFVNDLSSRPARDNNDVRVQHLALLKSAAREIDAMRVAK